MDRIWNKWKKAAATGLTATMIAGMVPGAAGAVSVWGSVTQTGTATESNATGSNAKESITVTATPGNAEWSGIQTAERRETGDLFISKEIAEGGHGEAAYEGAQKFEFSILFALPEECEYPMKGVKEDGGNPYITVGGSKVYLKQLTGDEEYYSYEMTLYLSAGETVTIPDIYCETVYAFGENESRKTGYELVEYEVNGVQVEKGTFIEEIIATGSNAVKAVNEIQRTELMIRKVFDGKPPVQLPIFRIYEIAGGNSGEDRLAATAELSEEAKTDADGIIYYEGKTDKILTPGYSYRIEEILPENSGYQKGEPVTVRPEVSDGNRVNTIEVLIFNKRDEKDETPTATPSEPLPATPSEPSHETSSEPSHETPSEPSQETHSVPEHGNGRRVTKITDTPFPKIPETGDTSISIADLSGIMTASLIGIWILLKMKKRK